MCVVCRQKFDKRALTRLVYTPAGLRVDETGKLSGRGAYLCDNSRCWERARQSNVLERALRTTLTAADKQQLLEH
jgi:hypothetical protein